LVDEYTELDYRSDINDIPVPAKSFDVVLCTEVLEHVPEPIKAVKEIGRILKGGGRLLLTAPLGSFLHQEPQHFYGGFTPHWYRKFLTQAGFEIESIEPNQGFFSWFGQEAVRFSTLIEPQRTRHIGMLGWIGLSVLWLITLAFLRGLFPLIGGLMDRLSLEQIATVGYHVVAIKL
jgi:SAM-dependent methyltransferase